MGQVTEGVLRSNGNSSGGGSSRGGAGVVALVALGEQPSTPYKKGSRWYYDGKIYTALTTTTADDGETPNSNTAYLYNGVYYYWNGEDLTSADESNLVHKSETETITGDKTFDGVTKAVTPAIDDISRKVATTEFVYLHGLKSHEELGVSFNTSSATGTRILGASSLNFSISTDLAAGTDDFKEHEAFAGYYAIVRYDSVTQKAQEYAVEGTFEYDECFELGTDNRKHLKPGNYLFRMFHIFWYKLNIDDSGNITVIISAEPKEGYLPSPAHDRNGTLHEWIGIAAYAIGETSENDDGGFAVRDDVPPMTYKTITAFETLVRTRGLRLFGFKEMMTLQLLGLVKYANLNWQSAIGDGNTGGWNDSLKAQTTESDVDFIIVKKSDWTGASYDTIPNRMKTIAIDAAASSAVWYKVLNAEDYTIENDATEYTKVTIDGTISTTADTTIWCRGMETVGNIYDIQGIDGKDTGNGTYNSGRCPAVSMGIWHLWGNCGEFAGGIAGVGDGTNEKVYINPNPDGEVDYSKTTITTYWIEEGTAPTASVNNGVFQASTSLDKPMFLFKDGTASSGKTGDQQYFAHANNTVYRAFYGGTCYSGANAGGFFLVLYGTVSSADRSSGGRCVFVPTL